MSCSSQTVKRRQCGASNPEFQARVNDIVSDEARRVVEKMLGLTDVQIALDRARELVAIADEYRVETRDNKTRFRLMQKICE
jgi:hypothetical protein